MNLTDAYYLRHYPVIHHQDGFKLVREISITEFSALCIMRCEQDIENYGSSYEGLMEVI